MKLVLNEQASAQACVHERTRTVSAYVSASTGTEKYYVELQERAMLAHGVLSCTKSGEENTYHLNMLPQYT